MTALDAGLTYEPANCPTIGRPFRPGFGSRLNLAHNWYTGELIPEPGLMGGFGADGSVIRANGRGSTAPKAFWRPPANDPIHETRQYSSGKSSVVTDRSASVIIQSFSPAFVW